jgi:acylphosphatase
MTSGSGSVKQIYVIYSGNVQGVGFRFAARRTAVRLGVDGFVRNLPSGDVELVCRGYRGQLEDIISALDDAMSGYIRERDVTWQRPDGSFSGFDIRF